MDYSRNPETAAQERNAKLIAEGFDLPNAGGGAFVAPDGSLVSDEETTLSLPSVTPEPVAVEPTSADALSMPGPGQMRSRLNASEHRGARDLYEGVQIAPRPQSLNLSQDDSQGGGSGSASKVATFYDSGLNLANKEGDDGLIYKAVCKTGTLALSPGPGQIDVDQPLQLTSELFHQLKESVDEQAFPYCTIPLTHDNGMLENTGYVRNLAIEPSTDPNDPPGTEILWAGMDFTEPDIKDKVLRGTIPDTSVGVKFSYRNKRTGKTYPAALEHVALTHQPWVDGLTPFGQDRLLSINAAEKRPADEDFLGVFMAQESEPAKPKKSRRKGLPARRTGDILPDDKGVGGITPTLQASQTKKRKMPTKKTSRTPKTVEQLMASQQVQIEQAQAELEATKAELALAQGTTAANAAALHLSQVEQDVKAWQEAGVTPAVARYAKDILLAVGPEPEPTADNAALMLSITKTVDGEPVVEETPLSLSQIVKDIVALSPKIGSGDIATVMAEMDELNASQTKTKSAKEKAQEAYDSMMEVRNGGVQ